MRIISMLQRFFAGGKAYSSLNQKLDYNFHVDDLRNEFQIIQAASERGSKNEPSVDEPEGKDKKEAQIKFWYHHMIQECKLNTSTILRDHRLERNQIYTSYINKLNQILTETKTKVAAFKSFGRNSLRQLRQKERGLLREKRIFKIVNNLTREPSPSTHPFVFSTEMLVLAFVESMLNAYFFSKGSDLGLIGGWLKAVIISFVNLGGSLAAGFFILKRVNYPDNRKTFYLSLSAIFVLLNVIFNMLVAHFRVVLEYDPQNAIALSISRFVQNPFAITNFDAIVLFLVGILLSSYALFKGYVYRDKYPGYGILTEDHKSAQEEYDSAKEDLIATIYKEIEDTKNKVQQIVSDLTSDFNLFNALINASKDRIGEYYIYIQDIENMYILLLKEYRENISQIINHDPPNYFDNFSTIPDKDKELAWDSDEDISLQTTFAEFVNKVIQHESQATQIALSDIWKFEQEGLSIWFKEIEDEIDLAPEDEQPKEKEINTENP